MSVLHLTVTNKECWGLLSPKNLPKMVRSTCSTEVLENNGDDNDNDDADNLS